ncbi:hypothetical protein MOQ_002189 [Trypanosoma cruzi marinkellei]|uniref:Potassium channel tetramerisation-type BTB domain-containing protein n=1 Tax=Trypanosoma cruzi marinkellei TaxID=85056 RepID=K2NIS4_TRYCR|nr:hypothetical protein MOQ_002189 [Trypanosoma cruzi marinkellei]
MSFKLYKTPEVMGEEGLPLVSESSSPPERQRHAFDALEQNRINEENEESAYGGSNRGDTGNEEVFMETLLHQFEHLQSSAKAYIRVSQSAFSRIQLKRQRMEQHERSLRHRAEMVAASSLSPKIKLNIGGMRFHVQRATLLQFSMTIFHLLEDERFNTQKDEFGHIFFDRDPWLFRELLFLLRERRQRIIEAEQFGSGPLPGGTEYNRLAQLPLTEWKRLMDEAKYYGLNELVNEVVTTRFQWQQCEIAPADFGEYARGALPHNESNSCIPLEGRCFSTCLLANDDVFLFGGCAENEAVLDSLYRLWLESDDMDEECNEGIVGEGENARPVRMQRLRYDLVQPFCAGDDGRGAPDPRSGHAMIVLHNRYVLLFYGNDLHSHLNDVWLYHITRNTWIRVKVRGTPVEPRSGHTVTVVGNRFYLIGGKKLFGVSRRLFSEVFEGVFDINRVELTWSSVAWTQQSESLRRPLEEEISSLPYEGAAATAVSREEEEEGLCSVPPIAYHSAVEYKGRYIVVYGGLCASAGTHVEGGGVGEGRWSSMAAASSLRRDVSPQLYQFDTVEYKWRFLQTSAGTQNLNLSDIPQSGHIALRHQDEMYVMGSYKEQRQLAIFQLSLRTLMWRQLQTTVAPMHSIPRGRAMPSGVLLPASQNNPNAMILLYGGYDVTTRQYLDDAYLLAL